MIEIKLPDEKLILDRDVTGTRVLNPLQDYTIDSYSQGYKDGYEAFRKLLESEEKENKAHWIDHLHGRWIYAKCSVCEKIQDAKSNYCPNCGARMTESEDKE